MDFHRNFLFDVVPFLFGIIGLIFYLGLFVLIVLVIVFLYKKIQSESKIECIEKELQDFKEIIEDIEKNSKGDLNEK
jgi:CHASE3 domain sensor protein